MQFHRQIWVWLQMVYTRCGNCYWFLKSNISDDSIDCGRSERRRCLKISCNHAQRPRARLTSVMTQCDVSNDSARGQGPPLRQTDMAADTGTSGSPTPRNAGCRSKLHYIDTNRDCDKYLTGVDDWADHIALPPAYSNEYALLCYVRWWS